MEVDEAHALYLKVPVPTAWSLAQLCETQPNLTEVAGESSLDVGYFFALNDLLLRCTTAAFTVSDDISTTYFTHSGQTDQSLGA